jgi:transcriptional regulator with XRE-family HTH domain
MSVALSVAQKPWIGLEAKRLRQALILTQHELATMAGVTLEEVDSFEHGLPVRLDVKLKILRELWLRKARIKINRDPLFS